MQASEQGTGEFSGKETLITATVLSVDHEHFGCPVRPRSARRCLLVLLFTLATGAILVLNGPPATPRHLRGTSDVTGAPAAAGPKLYARFSDFEGFDNWSGAPSPIVPNLVHFLRFDQPHFRFVEAMCVLAAIKNQRPSLLLLHTNTPFSGKYWDLLLLNPRFREIHRIHRLDLPSHIFGQPLSAAWRLQHASDVTRLRILIRYGGIYLDTDTYVVSSLDPLRRFEMALPWDQDQFLGTQTLVAHPRARFLLAWLETYRGHYDPTRWYYNAGERPTTEVLRVRPELVHRVRLLLGSHTSLAGHVYRENWPAWRGQLAVHLLLNHRWRLDSENQGRVPEFDELNIWGYNFTIGDMLRDVMTWHKLIVNQTIG